MPANTAYPSTLDQLVAQIAPQRLSLSSPQGAIAACTAMVAGVGAFLQSESSDQGGMALRLAARSAELQAACSTVTATKAAVATWLAGIASQLSSQSPLLSLAQVLALGNTLQLTASTVGATLGAAG
jgi:hypothetical protein